MRLYLFQAILILPLFILLSCSGTVEEKTAEKEKTYLCDAEIFGADGGKFLDAGGSSVEFDNQGSKSEEESFTGDFSIKLFPGNPFGFTANIPKIKPDDFLQLTVWRKSKGTEGVVVVDGGDEELYKASDHIVDEKDGWQKLLLEYFVPPDYLKGKLKVYVWNNGKDTVYFDDFQIVHKKRKEYPDYGNLPGLKIHIDDLDYKKYEAKRLDAFKTSFLFSSDEDYSPAVILGESGFLNGRIRLKGDLTDHLQGEKWSFRIKMRDEFVWNHLRTFSVQNPSTRHFLYEWLAHKAYENEDVLTTRYGFVPLSLNERSLGIYAWEEHFEKQLIENRNRREGPILKFDEDIFWRLLRELKIGNPNLQADYFAASKIVPFKPNRTISDSLLYQQFIEGQNLLTQYKNQTEDISDIFDVDRLACYYAVTDVFQAFHGFTWHNQRFYYNPVTCLLEPIAFDGYIEDGIYKRIDERVNGLVAPERIMTMSRMELMQYQVFSDSSFNRRYVEYLEVYSDPDYIENLISMVGPEIDSISKILKQEFPYFRFSFDYVQEQAAFIQNNLVSIKKNLNNVGKAIRSINREKFKRNYSTDISGDLVPLQVNAYYNKEESKIDVLNYCNVPIKILGVFIQNGLPISFDSRVELREYNGLEASQAEVTVEGKPVVLLFSIGNKMYETPVNQWPLPGGPSSRQIVLSNSSNESLVIRNDSVLFSGSYRFKNDVVIPDSMTVIIEKGTEMDFIDQAGFFSFSPVIAGGTQQEPIQIRSSDRSCNGFNLIQPGEKSLFSHVRFSGLGNLRRTGWQSPAAVTLYEADVDMEYCTFTENSNCDDALNIVRSNFSVSNCIFSNTFADAFDSDFCTGTVTNCEFKTIGNDAIDFSGSDVQINKCRMMEIGDKAISGGENSRLAVSDCEVNGANIGVAAKDLSTVKMDRIKINDVIYGITAFVKKPEYGPAKIIIDNLQLKNKLVFHQIEEGSSLVLNGTLIEGREKKLAVKLYQ